jgi:hypothetical protein
MAAPDPANISPAPAPLDVSASYKRLADDKDF